MWIVAIFDFPRHCKSGRQNMNHFGRTHRRRIANIIEPRSTLLQFVEENFIAINNDGDCACSLVAHIVVVDEIFVVA